MTRRLVLLTPGYSEPGGVATRSRALASALAGRGWRVLVIARGAHLHHPRLSRQGNLTALEVPGFGVDRLGSLLFFLCALPLGTVTGLCGGSFLAIKLMSSSSAAALCGMLSRRPFVSMSTSSGADSEVVFLEGKEVHGHSATPPSGHFGAGLEVRRRLLRRAAFIVAQTPSAADELTQLINRNRIVVIPNPVRIAEAAPLAQRCRAVFTGRLSREKDLFTLLESWRAIVSVRPDAFLTIVGEGGRYQSVEQEVREIVADTEALRRSVCFTGWVPNVTPHLLDSDVFILPSLWEGMSNSLLEACAHGRVVVASDIPANRAVVGDDYPLLFPPGDPAALASAVLQAFDDKARQSQATAVIAARMREFSLESVADRLEQVILRADADAGLSRPRQLKEVLAKRLGRLIGPGTEPLENSTNTYGHDSAPRRPTVP